MLPPLHTLHPVTSHHEDPDNSPHETHHLPSSAIPTPLDARRHLSPRTFRQSSPKCSFPTSRTTTPPPSSSRPPHEPAPTAQSPPHTPPTQSPWCSHPVHMVPPKP
ncbi:unnamed protein product [Pleuronectes platessa]|uniref:Uncharacterized protein n=1 Tax=Pleuronectes platessa TaxID=8262 RepID=A0A9N7YTK5_PLEPL|nr:unnamed protein product [Pleuronectes platessa]